MDFLENFQVDEKCENEAFLHENYIKMPQNTISAKNPILLQIHTFPRIPQEKFTLFSCFFKDWARKCDFSFIIRHSKVPFSRWIFRL